MRILVTGAAGFIGSYVAEAYVQAGHEVVGLDNLSTGRRENLPSSIPLWEMDLVWEGALEACFSDFRPEIISHHAAQTNVRTSMNCPLADAQSNILGSIALFAAAKKWGAQKIIYASSGGAVYGEPEQLPATEDHPIRPCSNYGISKYAAELYLKATGIPCVIFRYGNVYGPRQDPAGESGVVAIFTTQLLGGETPHIFGDGSKSRDYIYIDDIVAANLKALEYWNSTGTFNLGCGKGITDLEVFQIIKRAIGSGPAMPSFFPERPGEVRHIYLDAAEALHYLWWTPKISFSDGVKKVVEYWKQRTLMAQ